MWHRIGVLLLLIAFIGGAFYWWKANQSVEITTPKTDTPRPLSGTLTPLVAENRTLLLADESTPALPPKLKPEVPKVSSWFSESGRFDEVGGMEESAMEKWWLNSGAYVEMADGIARTVQGELDQDDKRRTYYQDYSASETDDGYHPQNIFRLVTKSQWQNLDQECSFKINRIIESEDEHRSESNGLLLFNRYQDGDNLYYTGLRVDGTAVIKKKIKGEYFTLAQKPVYPGDYNRKKQPNLLPVGEWIGVRSLVRTEADGTVTIKVYVDDSGAGKWLLALTATDTGEDFGGKAITDAGYAGIRTDFMDVEFRDYRIDELPKEAK